MKNFTKYSYLLSLLGLTLSQTLSQLSPLREHQNAVLCLCYLCAVIFSLHVVFISPYPSTMAWITAITMWLILLASYFIIALAKNCSKQRIIKLRQAQTDIQARLLVNGKEQLTPAYTLSPGDQVVCEVGDTIPADGEVIDGIASVDESAITGESAPVIRESKTERSAVTMGTTIVSDRIVMVVTSEAKQSFMHKIIESIEDPKKEITFTERACESIFSALSILLLCSLIALKCFSDYSTKTVQSSFALPLTWSELAALLICLLPTAGSALLHCISISGKDRLAQKNVIVKDFAAVEASGEVDLLLLDKTGTITLGNRVAKEFHPLGSVSERELAQIAQLASIADETVEGRSIVILAKEKFAFRAENLDVTHVQFLPFSAQTKMSGIDFFEAGTHKCLRVVRKGEAKAILDHIVQMGGSPPLGVQSCVDAIARQGATPLLVCDNQCIVGAIALKDMIKGGIKERFEKLRCMGIKTVMITGDNYLTTAAIAAEAGVDDFIAEATPEAKLEQIRIEQRQGHSIAMTGDGSNDAPALAQADIGVAMNSGTPATRQAGNIIDLENNPTKLLDIVIMGKQLLTTRGALLLFCCGNSIAIYAILLPLFLATQPILIEQQGAAAALHAFNFLQLHSPSSALLSSMLYQIAITFALFPLAHKGVPYALQSPKTALCSYLLLYGLGGMLTPLLMIKVIDLMIGRL